MDYEEAVDLASRFLESCVDDHGTSARPIAADGALKANVLQVRGASRIMEEPTRIVEDARKSADAFDALRYGAAQWMKIGQALPPEIAHWVADYLCDKIERPIAEEGRPKKDALHIQILIVVNMLADNGLDKFRNQASEVRQSACDAVAEAMAQLGLAPSTYGGVKNVYLKLRSLQRPDGGIPFDF